MAFVHRSDGIFNSFLISQNFFNSYPICLSLSSPPLGLSLPTASFTWYVAYPKIASQLSRSDLLCASGGSGRQDVEKWKKNDNYVHFKCEQTVKIAYSDVQLANVKRSLDCIPAFVRRNYRDRAVCGMARVCDGNISVLMGFLVEEFLSWLHSGCPDLIYQYFDSLSGVLNPLFESWPRFWTFWLNF